MKMRGEIQRITEALDERHCAKVHVTPVDEPDLLAHLVTDPTGHRAHEHA